MRVFFKDLRPAKICPAAREIFFEPNGLSWREFLYHGIDSEKLLAVGSKREDVNRLISVAAQREKREASLAK